MTHDLQFEAIFDATWSPDGKQIVLDGGSDPAKQHPDHKLYLLNADGSGLKQLAPVGDTNDQDPDWSPDGEWIVFHRNCSLWVVRPDGAEAKMLLDQAEELCAVSPQWSPDNQRIAFLNGSDKADQGELWLINRDGGDAHSVYTFDRKEWPWTVGWSPDGRQIDLWYTQEKGKDVLVNADGSGEPEVVNQPDIDKLHLWTWFSRFWPRWAK